jgi:hypothetical protein
MKDNPTSQAEARSAKLWEIFASAKKNTDAVSIEAGELQWLLKIVDNAISMMKRFPKGPTLSNIQDVLNHLVNLDGNGPATHSSKDDDIRRMDTELWMVLRAHGKPVAFKVDDIPDDFIVTKQWDRDKQEITLSAHLREELPAMIAAAEKEGIPVIRVEHK